MDDSLLLPSAIHAPEGAGRQDPPATTSLDAQFKPFIEPNLPSEPPAARPLPGIVDENGVICLLDSDDDEDEESTMQHHGSNQPSGHIMENVEAMVSPATSSNNNDVNSKAAHATNQNERQWMFMFELLKEFKNKYRHMDPYFFDAFKGGGLGRWVYRQRHLKRQKRLKSNRVEMLNAIGFLWESSRIKKKTADASVPANPSHVGRKMRALWQHGLQVTSRNGSICMVCCVNSKPRTGIYEFQGLTWYMVKG